MTEDRPTEPGPARLPSNLRVHRAFDQFDAIMFDAPILPLTYVGVRKSTLAARQREVTINLWVSGVVVALTLAVLAIL